MNVLVDTSAWIQHLRKEDPGLTGLLASMRVITHSAVIGELALGSLRNRHRFLGDLKVLPGAIEASPAEVLEWVESRKLYGRGLSWVDAQILASAVLSESGILTRDKAMLRVMKEVSIQGSDS